MHRAMVFAHDLPERGNFVYCFVVRDQQFTVKFKRLVRRGLTCRHREQFESACQRPILGASQKNIVETLNAATETLNAATETLNAATETIDAVAETSDACG
ncbi:MAG: hypothetical protein GY822_03010 [Deltaproteobacteria bacterium]|nr:hypothetical protein [Deltaproteobacteria bacterium]